MTDKCQFCGKCFSSIPVHTHRNPICKEIYQLLKLDKLFFDDWEFVPQAYERMKNKPVEGKIKDYNKIMMKMNKLKINDDVIKIYDLINKRLTLLNDEYDEKYPLLNY